MDATIYTHKLTTKKDDPIVTDALRILRPRLPVSIPLLRRLQFGRFFEATTLLTSIENLHDEAPEGQPWLIAFVDRTCRPETETYLYASWESSSTPDLSDEGKLAQDSLVRSLAKAIKNLGALPVSLHQDVLDKAALASASSNNDDEQDTSGVSRKDYTAHLLNPNLILCGAVHSSTTKILERNNLIKHVFDAGLVPNWTFIFNISELPPVPELPEGLYWGELRDEHFALVRSRTQIPRQDRTLAELPNLAIYHGEVPIAWVFVGLDGSLTTLHVEQEWRGKGLARTIAIKLWKEKMGRFWERDEEVAGERWAHDYVISGNEASKKVSERLGGRYYADTYWVRVDLEKA
ncbi:Putative acyl-CoA N-acyltransferase [Septoria linicola]|uniref:Acyl-CoA N-acyltransferase n=1 Tax=Septoria linicola TaxID=215465 RepID=A0A9Q9AWB2_9PEZI|nr:Putative acyl-CoA N-acyltransferase [Septoria linicola]